VGSLYHRFGSRDELLARLWIRAVRRSQADFLAAIDRADPIDGAVSGAMAILDFCERKRTDARLLLSFRREDLLHAKPSPELTRALEVHRGVGTSAPGRRRSRRWRARPGWRRGW
jgi:AcrR family transcriptional regulator